VYNIWIVSLLFWVLLYIYIVFLLERAPLLSIKNFISISFLSVLTTIIFNFLFYNQGYDQLLPQNSIWFWTTFFIFIVSCFWYRHKTITDNFQGKIERYIKLKKEKFERQYKELFNDLPNREKNILLAILIVEDYNRPKIIRIFEGLFSYFGLAKTTGLAQISKKGLSDRESVKLLKEKIRNYFQKKDFNIENVREFLKKYNGKNYDEMVLAILQNLDTDFIE